MVLRDSVESTVSQGAKIGDLTVQLFLSEIIDGPRYILPNSYSCIDLIFTVGSDFIFDSGVYPSLYW